MMSDPRPVITGMARARPRRQRPRPGTGLWGVGDPEETRDEAFRDGTVKQDHGFGKLKLKIDSTKLVTKPPNEHSGWPVNVDGL